MASEIAYRRPRLRELSIGNSTPPLFGNCRFEVCEFGLGPKKLPFYRRRESAGEQPNPTSAILYENPLADVISPVAAKNSLGPDNCAS